MILPNDSILIIGDSWGCGEWSASSDPYRVTHLGLEHFLKEYGCTVINLSRPGASNKTTVQIFKDHVDVFDPKYIFWFQTDPMRDLRPYDQETFPKDVASLLGMSELLLNDTYKELNEMDRTIHCMGGTTKLHSAINNYQNLVSFIPSIIEMFGGTDQGFWISDWINADNLKFTEKFLSELEQHPMHSLPKEWFWPDGAHPNQNAHRKIFEYILGQ